MHGARDQLLSGTALTVNQHRTLGRGHSANGLFEFFHRRAGTDDVVQRISGGRVAFESKVLAAERNFFQSLTDGDLDLIDQAWGFTNVVGCTTRFDGLYSGFVVIHRRNKDDR